MMRVFMTMTIALVLTTALAACASTPTSTAGYKPAIKQQSTSSSAQKVKQMTLKEEQKNSMAKMPMVQGQPVKLTASETKTETGTKAIDAANADATKQPVSTQYVNAIMYFSYQPGLLYKVYCAPLHVTDIELQHGEKVVSVAAGDTTRWQVSKTTSGEGLDENDHILIKPESDNVSNNIVITTTERTYHLLLVSATDSYMPIVAWHYPSQSGLLIDNRQQLLNSQQDIMDSGLSLNHLDFDYHVSLVSAPDNKAPNWVPTMVFNDGSKTYIQFAHQLQESPSLFVGSKAYMVNYRVDGDFFIIDSTPHEMQLRMGQKDQTVVQITYEGNKQS